MMAQEQAAAVVVANVITADEVHERGKPARQGHPESTLAGTLFVVRENEVGLAHLAHDRGNALGRLTIVAANKLVVLPAAQERTIDEVSSEAIVLLVYLEEQRERGIVALILADNRGSRILRSVVHHDDLIRAWHISKPG